MLFRLHGKNKKSTRGMRTAAPQPAAVTAR
jgi:hypothetical protein